MEPRIRVSAILRWNDRILLCRHEKPGKEYWLLPGGGVNSGESLVDALERELAELRRRRDLALAGQYFYEAARLRDDEHDLVDRLTDRTRRRQQEIHEAVRRRLGLA